ncbi:hypothetical protein JCM15765_23540 [Paradesulfitobacterium aromaticivorans]
MVAYVKSLRRVREEVLGQLATDREHRVKWLVQLMDIDDELEELEGHDKIRIIEKVKGSARIEEIQKPQKPKQRGRMKSGRTRGVVFILSPGEKRA